MTPEAWILVYQSQARMIFAIAATHDDCVVPTCPEWTLFDLAAHVGAAPVLWGPVLEAPAGQPPGEVLRPYVPEVKEEMLAWCEVELQSMVELFRSTDPDTAAWTGAEDGTAAFWMRRAALETAVHLWDAAVAVGMRSSVPDDLACDGFDELVELFPILQRWSGKYPEVSLTVAPDGVDRTWTFCGRNDDAMTQLSGRAGDVYLQLWGRKEPAHAQEAAVVAWVELIQEMTA